MKEYILYEFKSRDQDKFLVFSFGNFVSYNIKSIV